MFLSSIIEPMRRLALLVACLAVAAAACSSPASSDPPASTVTVTATVAADDPLTSDEPFTTDGGDPNDGLTPATEFAFTDTITITDAGFQPRKAVAVLGQRVTFVNLTATAQVVRFTNGTFDPEGEVHEVGPIPPGQSMSTPEATITISLVYGADGLPGQTGVVQIDPGQETY